MLKVKMKRSKKSKLLNIRRSVKKISGQSTEVGYFQSQGKHSGGMYSYTALAQALELGYFPVQQMNRIPMPFMTHIVQRTIYGLSSSMSVKRAYRAWGRSLGNNGTPVKLLDAVGELAIQQSRFVFNNRAYFPDSPNNKTPLYETGDLMKHFTYKDTYNGVVRRT